MQHRQAPEAPTYHPVVFLQLAQQDVQGLFVKIDSALPRTWNPVEIDG
jgi:hypothetical protein